MSNFFKWFLVLLLRCVLKLRYRITYVGLDKLDKKHLTRPGGTVFLPSHPTVTVDPLMVVLPIYPKFRVRPLITEYMYIKPVIHWAMQWLEGLPVPDFDRTSNSAKIRRNEKSFQTVIDGLQSGSNFVVYPSGRSKQTGLEVIAGRSGVHRILQEAPDANVVLVRTTGLWGSSFSRALTGRAPDFFGTLWAGVKTVLKNLIFFVPKREVTIEFIPAPKEFPRSAPRAELNRYLEEWYNTPPGKDPKKTPITAEPLSLVSYSFWKEDLPVVGCAIDERDEQVKLELIPSDVKERVFDHIAQMAKVDASTLSPDQDLASDLGLDSLDAIEIVVFLEDSFGISGAGPSDFTTVRHVLGLASGQIEPSSKDDEDSEVHAFWKEGVSRPDLEIPEGTLIPEVFLATCDRLGKLEAVVDARSGVLTFKQLKLRVLLLADKIKTLPGDRIGILLPASVGASVVFLACQLAGKVPVMINWTQGPRHLDTVVKVSGIQVTLTAWGFIDRLENVDLKGIDDQLIMLEELRHEFSLRDKLRALFRSFRSPKALIQAFGLTEHPASSPAVVLFTSGTERAPKGVPLSHENILSNLRSGISCIGLEPDDVILAMLPPFHSFGCTLTGLMPILAGLRTAFSPDPTDGQRIANDVGKWKATLVAGAPSFLRAFLKAATPEQLSHLRLLVSGAEKVPPELMEQIQNLGSSVRFIEGYGITECSPMLTMTRLSSSSRGVGQPIPGVDLKVVHPETLEPLERGERGLILASGPNIFGGYMSLEDLPSPFVTMEGKKWYNTGDLGFLDSEGNLSISGRLKRFVKVGGEMVSLTAVETALLEAGRQKKWPMEEGAPSLAVCAKEDGVGKTEFHVFSSFSIPLEEVNLSLRSAGFSNLVKISKVHQLGQIPIMGTGKIAYRQLDQLL